MNSIWSDIEARYGFHAPKGYAMLQNDFRNLANDKGNLQYVHRGILF